MPSNCPRVIKKHVRLSVPCFTGFLCMVAIIVAVACTMVISEIYAMAGTDLLAKSTATAMASTAHQKVDAFMNSAYTDADSLQFMLVMTERRLPTDTIAAGKFSNLTWPDEYLTLCSLLMRGSGFQYSYISFNFDDGAAALCQRGDEVGTFDTVSSMVISDTEDRAFTLTTTYTIEGALLSREISDESYDSRTRTWYNNVPQEARSKIWMPIGFVGLTPAASLIATMTNSTGHFLGALSVSFSIENVSTLLEQAKPLISSDIILLDEKFSVVGSTVDIATSSTRAVPNTYALSELEKAGGCILSDTGSETEYALLVCHHTIDSYGYVPLQGMYNNHKELLDDVDAIVNVDRIYVNNGYYYVSVMGLSYASLNAWRILCFLPEKEITSNVVAGRKVVISVTISIVVLVGAISAVAAKLLLRPLTRVVRLMRSAAYLSEAPTKSTNSNSSDIDKDSDSGTEENQLRIKAQQAQRELLKDRTLSAWYDVRSIQRAYWAMADELGELQGYIPEHVRDGILESRRQRVFQGVHSPLPHSGPLGLLYSPKDDDARASSKASSASDSPRLDHAALTLRDNQNPAANLEASIPSVLVEMLSVVPRSEAAVDPAPIPSTVLLSNNDELEEESIDDVSVAAARLAFGHSDHTPTPIIFGDNVLVDRDITIVHINILQFHMYAQNTHGRTITEEHEAIVNYIYTAARKCGGNLENFIGDKFWISFNATSKCQDGQIAAACLGYEVTHLMNRDALSGQLRRKINHEKKVQNLPHLPHDAQPTHRFKAAPFGVSCGISTGRAFVGPLGTKAIKRHSILSNALTEASALERLSLRYPGCSVMIGGDMIPAIEGYFQYFIIDAALLPGSGGKRRRIASLKGPMLGAGRNPLLHRGAIKKEMPFPTENAFKGINDCFNAFLEGRMDNCAGALKEVDEATSKDLKTIADTLEMKEKEKAVSKGKAKGSQDNELTDSFISSELEEQCAEIGLMSRLLWSIISAPTPVDGRVYRSPFGEMYMPIIHALRLVTKGEPPNTQQAMSSARSTSSHSRAKSAHSKNK